MPKVNYWTWVLNVNALTTTSLSVNKPYEYLVSSDVTQRIYFLFRKMQCKDQIDTINIWPFNEWTACLFSPLRLWKLKLMHTTVIEEAREVYPEPEKGHGGQARVSLECLMFQWLSDCIHDRPCIIKTHIWEVAIALLWLLAA